MMAYGLVIAEAVSLELGELDPVHHDLIVLEILGLQAAPMERGDVLDVDGSACRRMLGLGDIAVIFYNVDDEAKTVTVVDLVARHG